MNKLESSILFGLSLVSTICFSQETLKDSTKIQFIKANIFAYNISHPQYNSAECYNSAYLYSEFKKSRNYKIEKSNVIYPKGNIELYSVEDTQSYTFSDGVPFSFLISTRKLIGINKLNDGLLFISGSFYKTQIAEDFELNSSIPESFIEFLKLKLYNYNIEQIKFIKEKKDFLYFRAYSNVLNVDILIKVNGEFLMVKHEKSGWTEDGSFNWKN